MGHEAAEAAGDGQGNTPMETKQVVHSRDFDFSGFLALVKREPRTDGASCGRSSRKAGYKDYPTDKFPWSGTESWQDALDLAHKGWPDGLKDIKGMSEKIWKVVGQQIQKTTFFYDVSGAQPDVDRFLLGEPENMIQFQQEESVGHGKIVKIFVNSSASCGVSVNTMFVRGAAVVALVNALESLGFSCEVCTADAVAGQWHGDAQILQYNVMLKRAGGSLDLDRLAFALAQPAWFRRLVFSAMEQEPESIRSMIGVGYGYGCPTESRGLTSAERGIDVPSLRFGTHHWEDIKTATAWVLDAASKVLGRPVNKVA